jgi:hypothetical protein
MFVVEQRQQYRHDCGRIVCYDGVGRVVGDDGARGNVGGFGW